MAYLKNNSKNWKNPEMKKIPLNENYLSFKDHIKAWTNSSNLGFCLVLGVLGKVLGFDVSSYETRYSNSGYFVYHTLLFGIIKNFLIK